jgi:S-methylmethionine-dependent homocysteine/selenocysteine methylase
VAGFTLLDGGLSTELARIGAKFGGELWTGRALLEDPSLVEVTHRNYALAGAQVVTSASYQLSRQGFAEIGLSASDADRALTESIAVAKRAVATTDSKVAASIGPYGAVLHDGSEYRGDYKVDQAFLEDFHFERLTVLAKANPDYLAVETIPNLVEARALVIVLREFDLPTWFAFTAQSETLLWSGESIEEALSIATETKNLVAVGFNCVAPEIVTGLLATASSVTSAPKIVYPNRGGTWDSANGVWVGDAPLKLSERLPEWLEAGANWVGGCCGTDASDISDLKSAKN